MPWMSPCCTEAWVGAVVLSLLPCLAQALQRGLIHRRGRPALADARPRGNDRRDASDRRGSGAAVLAASGHAGLPRTPQYRRGVSPTGTM
jgi:hypothetical protein